MHFIGSLRSHTSRAEPGRLLTTHPQCIHNVRHVYSGQTPFLGQLTVLLFFYREYIVVATSYLWWNNHKAAYLKNILGRTTILSQLTDWRTSVTTVTTFYKSQLFVKQWHSVKTVWCGRPSGYYVKPHNIHADIKLRALLQGDLDSLLAGVAFGGLLASFTSFMESCVLALALASSFVCWLLIA